MLCISVHQRSKFSTFNAGWRFACVHGLMEQGTRSQCSNIHFIFGGFHQFFLSFSGCLKMVCVDHLQSSIQLLNDDFGPPVKQFNFFYWRRVATTIGWFLSTENQTCI